MSSIQGSVSAVNIVTLDEVQTLTNKTIELDTTDLQNNIPLIGSNRCITSNSIKFALNLKQDTLGNNDITNSMLAGSIDQSKITNLTTDLSNKQDTLGNNDITNAMLAGSIAQSKITNLTTDLSNKQSTIGNNDITNAMLAGSIAQSKITNLTTDLSNKQDTLGNNDITNAMLAGSIDQSKITNLTTDLSNKQNTLTFNDPSARNGNPSTSIEIDNYLINNYQPKNNLIYDATNDRLGVDVQPYRKFDMGAVRVAFGDNVTLNNNQGLYWHTDQFDYSIAREAGGWGSTRELAIRWATGIRFQVDPSRTIRGNVAYTNSSDDRLKHNELEISNALTTINKLHVKKYYKTGTIYDPSGNVYPPDYNLTEEELETTPHTEEIGIVAQEIQQISELEFVVKDNGLDASNNQNPYSVNYESIHNLLIKAVQELSLQVNELKQEVNELKQK